MNSNITGQPVWTERLPGGNHWSARLRPGRGLRLRTLGDGANVSALFFSAQQPLERYNMPDTLKTQHTAYLTAGHALHSDMGRVLCSITADTAGWHDTWCGVSDAGSVRARYGERRYQEHGNRMFRNGRDGLLIEMAKYGLGPADLVPNVNFFSKVVIDPEGALNFVCGHARSGASVDLRFEMETLVFFSAAPHPLDPSRVYAPADVELCAYEAGPVGMDDPCRTSCEQNERAFTNTERHVLG
jgi:urea carboxylase-associated protein 2